MADYVFSNNRFALYEGDFIQDILGGVPGPWGGDHPPNYRLLKVIGREDSALTLVIYEALHPEQSRYPFWVNPILFEGSSALGSAVLIPTLPDLLDFLSHYVPVSELSLSLSRLEKERLKKEASKPQGQGEPGS